MSFIGSTGFLQFTLYIRKYDFLCHDDVIIYLGEDDVIIDPGNIVTRCLNDVNLNDGQLSNMSYFASHGFDCS